MKFFNRKKKIKSSDFIYIQKDALPRSFCNNVIQKFELDDRKRQGQVGSGVRLDIKRSCDLSITGKEDWVSYDEAFFKSLNNALKEYLKFIPQEFIQFKALGRFEDDTGYQIQKTQPGDYYIWHHDQTKTRLVTFIWYLNDVKDDGYTEFIDGTRIQPEAGKLIIFPATWDFLHRGVSPKTETKYICTGWVHAEMMDG
jgi:Rps23 Pro-64 3,4-dihydroxylase Tpa1-like proline 4-hydroxylase